MNIIGPAPPSRTEHHDRGHSAATEGRWALCPVGASCWDETMMSGSTGKPAGGHLRVQPPAARPVPVQRHATAAAPRKAIHTEPRKLNPCRPVSVFRWLC
jgi:hypothetical protein